MGHRKIVKSGNSSFVLSLPIQWVRKNQLDSGKVVQVNESELGDLIISTVEKKVKPKEAYYTIKVDKKDFQEIHLELMTAFIRDYSSIILEGDEISHKTSRLLDDIRSFIGFDVIEQSTTSIVVKNFFSLDQEVSPRVILKKMDVINKAGIEILARYFDEGFSNEEFFELQKLTEQTLRLYALSRKCILKLLEDPKLMRSIQTNHLQTMKDRMYAHAYVEVSDQLLVIGKAFLILELSKKEEKILEGYYKTMNKDYQQLVNAISNNGYKRINTFLGQSATKKTDLNQFLLSSEDRVVVRAVSSLIGVYSAMEDLAYEALA
jgi:phosphate uptake regulator